MTSAQGITLAPRWARHVRPREHITVMSGWFPVGSATDALIWMVALVGVLLVLERSYVALSRSGFNGRPFIERAIQLVRAGKADEAIKMCSASRTVLADIALLILRTRT